MFTELIERMGVSGVDVNEVFDLSSLSLPPEQPCLGMVFLFQWSRQADPRPVTDPAAVPGLFFAHQTVTNACASQAVLSVLLNRPRAADLGPALTEFRAFALDLPADIRGEAIGESALLRAAHNAFEPPDALSTRGGRGGGPGRAYHYVAYVPVGGTVWELDGLKQGPIAVGKVPGWVGAVSADAGSQEAGAPMIDDAAGNNNNNTNNMTINATATASECNAEDDTDPSSEWRTVAAEAITARIARFSQASELEYSLLTIDKSALSAAEAAAAAARARGNASAAAAAEREAAALRGDRERARERNARRGHNYVPFAVELLRSLEREGKLDEVLAAAAPLSAARAEKKAAQKKKEEMEQIMALLYYSNKRGGHR